MIVLVYLLALLALAVHAPPSVWQPGAREFVVIVGVIGVWRYGWGAIHLLRSLWYRHRVFPALRRRADALLRAELHGAEPEELPRLLPRIFVVITSYRIRSDTTAAAFRAAIAEATRYGGRVTLVASIVEPADQHFIKILFYRLHPPERVRLVFVRLPPEGKRGALAAGLRAVARRMPRAGDLVVVMDGDTLLAPGVLRRCAALFRLRSDIGGLTTDEDVLPRAGSLLEIWHRLRFAQRHLLMCSIALSGRLLTMTGRMSMFRAEVATDPGFIDIVRNDFLEHWRFGRLPFLTGEDKSTWYWLLEHGHAMLYVPDVRVWTLEDPPPGNFFSATTQLMLRWFGNMLRGGRRALALGPGRCGAFVWWALVDQRVSMWTPLVSPTAAIAFTLAVSPVFLQIYAIWVLFTRLLLALGLLTVRPRIHGWYPLLLYYNQVYGALIKTYVLFHLDRQRWTRQNIALRTPVDAIARWSSSFAHVLALGSLVVAVGFLTHLLELPPFLHLVP